MYICNTVHIYLCQSGCFHPCLSVNRINQKLLINFYEILLNGMVDRNIQGPFDQILNDLEPKVVRGQKVKSFLFKLTLFKIVARSRDQNYNLAHSVL